MSCAPIAMPNQTRESCEQCGRPDLRRQQDRLGRGEAAGPRGVSAAIRRLQPHQGVQPVHRDTRLPIAPKTEVWRMGPAGVSPNGFKIASAEWCRPCSIKARR